MTVLTTLKRAARWVQHTPLRYLTVGVCAASSVYWLAIASDRYVSEARMIIQSTSLQSGASLDLGSLLAGSNGGSRTDQLLLREHLRSPDMARKLDDALALRQHYSTQGDWLSRLWSSEASNEDFYNYYLRRIQVEYDEFAGVLVLQSQGFTPEVAQQITQHLVIEGERFMNGMAHAIAQDQVTFLEGQVQALHSQVLATRRAVLDFQDKKGLISPEAAAQSIATIVATLQGQLVDLKAQRSALEAYLVKEHPNIVLLNQRITALEKQIIDEQTKLAAPGGKKLNRTAEAFAQLELQAKFALDVYKTALTALEQGRLESTRTLKKVSVLQQPTQPQDALQPRRLYTAAVWVSTILLLAGVLQLLIAVVRDHQD